MREREEEEAISILVNRLAVLKMETVRLFQRTSVGRKQTMSKRSLSCSVARVASRRSYNACVVESTKVRREVGSSTMHVDA